MMRKALVLFPLVLLLLVPATCVSAQPATTTKQVIFRDDDVEPTRWMNVLEAVNQVHIDENVPVTLAIIPHAYVGTDAQLFPDDQSILEPIPLGPSSPNASVNMLREDPAFLDYMRSIATNPLFEFAQHGYTHINNGLTPGSNNQSEFAGEPFDLQYAAIQQGRNNIEDAFGITPTTFVPPWDRGDLTTLKALRALGFTEYCTGGTEFPKLQGQVSGIRVEAAGVDIDGATYAAFNNSVQEAEKTTDQFFSDSNNNSTLIVAYHWWTFVGPGGSVDAGKVQLLRDYIDYVKNKEGVQFTVLDRQVTVNPEAVPGAASSLVDVSGTLTPYQLWLAGSVGVVYLLGFAWFVVSGRGSRNN
jgi:peptidoglycan/xylan/chitin deacetylase (PgdA/CDA1 family)